MGAYNVLRTGSSPRTFLFSLSSLTLTLTRHLLSPLSCKAAQQLQQYKVQLDTCCQYQMVKFTLCASDCEYVCVC